MEYKNKRGNLSNLMSENQKISGNVQILSYDFACRISRLFQYLTEDAEYKEFVMAKQGIQKRYINRSKYSRS
jgi:hypothetical protein